MLGDLAIAAAIALIALILAPGLAIVALGALLLLAGCGAWLGAGRLRARRARARGPVAVRSPDEPGPGAAAGWERSL
jgi:hypothetical protein